MKAPLLFAIILFMAVGIFAQKGINIYKNDGSGILTILTSNIDSITFPYLGPPCVGTPTVTYAGKVYNTAQIGQQCWLKENLDVGTQISGWSDQTNDSITEKYCYYDDPANCSAYGGYYQWDEAMQYVTTEKTQGICPSGWHIPTYAEFQTLATTVNQDGNALKTIGQGDQLAGGEGTNTSGFSALLAGYRLDIGTFFNINQITGFWSSTNAYGVNLNEEDSNISFVSYDKTYGFSIRCIKD